LGEQEPERVALRPGVRETMLALDARGILQSIASKNDRDDAWRVLERLAVSDLFLYPAINWQPKSANIRRILQELNLGADACALVDDSAFERAEVASQLPEMRVYADTDVAGLLGRPEFEVAVTEESRQRRLFYVEESGRKQAAAGYQGDYEAFLRTCNMGTKLFAPSQAAHVERSLEVLQRTNQLNLTTHRYTREEFDRLLDDGNAICICTSCRDRFGEYGLVGFASLRRQSDGLELVDFVMSCRVAQKKVENAWFGWLVREARAAGYGKIRARYVKTARNRVLLDTFLEVGFVETEKHDQYSLLELDCAATPSLSGLVAIDAAALRGALSAVMTQG
jgi:FkbH-like protein